MPHSLANLRSDVPFAVRFSHRLLSQHAANQPSPRSTSTAVFASDPIISPTVIPSITCVRQMNHVPHRRENTPPSPGEIPGWLAGCGIVFVSPLGVAKVADKIDGWNTVLSDPAGSADAASAARFHRDPEFPE